MSVSRRELFVGAAALVAAPAIVRVTSLMPVKAPPLVTTMEFSGLDLGAAAPRMEWVDEWSALLRREVRAKAEFVKLLYGDKPEA